MNPGGHPETLQARQVGNLNARRSGVHSERCLAEVAQPLLDEIAQIVHIESADKYAAEQAARLFAIVTLADADLFRRGLTNRAGEPRSLLAYRLRASSQLERYLVQLGMTPHSRRGLKPQVSIAERLSQLYAERDRDGAEIGGNE